jgi:hypothetical protein
MEEDVDSDRDDELERILQQTIPLSVQIKPSTTTSDKASAVAETILDPNKTTVKQPITVPKKPTQSNSKALTNSDPDKKLANHHHAKEDLPSPNSKPPPQKDGPRILRLDDLLKRELPVRYFIMKCADKTNLATALAQSIWSTQPQNERILLDAYDVWTELVWIFLFFFVHSFLFVCCLFMFCSSLLFAFSLLFR